MIKNIIAHLLRLSLLSVVLLGSCVGSGVIYIQSPKWQIEEVDIENDKTFFVAYTTLDSDDIEIIFYRQIENLTEIDKRRFKLPEEHYSKVWEGGGSATVTSKLEADGSQLVQIFSIGDTPWASLSEYRVIGDKIQPLRHGSANHLFLLGVLLSPFITWLLQKPVRRLVNRVVGVDIGSSGD